MEENESDDLLTENQLNDEVFDEENDIGKSSFSHITIDLNHLAIQLYEMQVSYTTVIGCKLILNIFNYDETYLDEPV